MINETMLQFLTTPEHYLELNHSAEKRNSFATMMDGYWKILPVYAVSRCPYCEQTTSEAIDTYSLRNWVLEASNGEQIFRERKLSSKHCQHLIVLQSFINFNGIRPERSRFELTEVSHEFPSEVPYVLGLLLEDDRKPRAVIHSLPICRIEDGNFVPRYTLFMVSYYANDPFRAAQLAGKLMHYRQDHFGLKKLVHPLREGDHDDWWDLGKWVENQRLLWIRPNDPEIIVVTGSYAEFPYGNINGRRFPYWELVPHSRAELEEMRIGKDAFMEMRRKLEEAERERREKFDTGEREKRAALEDAERTAEDGSDESFARLAERHIELGLFFHSAETFKRTDEQYQAAHSIYQNLAKKNPSRYRPELALILLYLGNLRHDQEEYTESERYYKESISIRRELASERPAEFENQLITSLKNLAILWTEQKHSLTETTACYDEILSRLYKRLENDYEETLPDIIRTLTNLAELYRGRDNYSPIESQYEKTLDLFRSLAQKKQKDFLPVLAVANYNLGLLHRDHKNEENAEAAFREAHTLYTKLAKQNAREYEPDIASVLAQLAGLCLWRRENRETSREYTREALRLVLAYPDSEKAVEIRAQIEPLAKHLGILDEFLKSSKS